MMMNFGQACLFSNLIAISVQCCGFWVSVVETVHFYWFQGRNLLGDDQNFKKGQDQISRGEPFLFINQIKLMSHFVPVVLFLFLQILH